MADKYIYLKMTKEWGGFRVGDVVRFGLTKGEGRIAAGEGIRVPKQRAVNDPAPEPAAELSVQKAPEAETATSEPDENKGTEKAVVTPRRRAKAEAPERKE